MTPLYMTTLPALCLTLFLDTRQVFNALDACEELKLTPDEMDAKWGKCKKVPSPSVACPALCS